MNQVAEKYHQDEDQLALERVQIIRAKDNPAEFASLYEKYFEQVYYFILKRVESEDTAGDVCSTVFLKALTNLSGYRDMGLPFSAWLFRIARNELFTLYHKKKLELVLSVESTGILQMVHEMGQKPDADYTDLHLAISQLPSGDIELIEMRFFEGRPFREIAQILEITETNAKVRTYRVLDKLKLKLKK